MKLALVLLIAQLASCTIRSIEFYSFANCDNLLFSLNVGNDFKSGDIADLTQHDQFLVRVRTNSDNNNKVVFSSNSDVVLDTQNFDPYFYPPDVNGCPSQHFRQKEQIGSSVLLRFYKLEDKNSNFLLGIRFNADTPQPSPPPTPKPTARSLNIVTQTTQGETTRAPVNCAEIGQMLDVCGYCVEVGEGQCRFCPENPAKQRCLPRSHVGCARNIVESTDCDSATNAPSPAPTTFLTSLDNNANVTSSTLLQPSSDGNGAGASQTSRDGGETMAVGGNDAAGASTAANANGDTVVAGLTPPMIIGIVAGGCCLLLLCVIVIGVAVRRGGKSGSGGGTVNYTVRTGSTDDSYATMGQFPTSETTIDDILYGE